MILWLGGEWKGPKGGNPPITGGELDGDVELLVCDFEKSVERTIHAVELVSGSDAIHSLQTYARILQSQIVS